MAKQVNKKFFAVGKVYDTAVMSEAEITDDIQKNLDILTGDPGLVKCTGLQKFGIEYHSTCFPVEKLNTVACSVHKDIHVPVTRIMPHDIGNYTTECMKTLPHIRRTVVQQIMKTVVKVKHGCRLE